MQDVQHQHPAFSGETVRRQRVLGMLDTICAVVTNSRLEATKYFLLLTVAGLALS